MRQVSAFVLAIAVSLSFSQVSFADQCGSGAVYGLVQVSSSTDDPPIASVDDQHIKIDHPTNLTQISLPTSVNPGNCSTYWNGSSYALNSNYTASGAQYSVEFWMMVHKTRAKPARIPMSTIIVLPSSASRHNPGTKFSNLSTVWPSTDSNNYGTCTPDSGATYYWPMCMW